MKKNSILINITLLYLVTGCSNTSPYTTTTSYTPTISNSLIVSSPQGGGNPEVTNTPTILAQCFKLQKRAREACFNLFHPGNINILTYPNYGEKIRLAGRKSAIEKKEFNLVGQERFIIAVDISKVQLPIKCNIPSALRSSDKDTITFDIPVKDIENSVIFSDRRGRLLLNYTVVK
jgi:hypothetical protein